VHEHEREIGSERVREPIERPPAAVERGLRIDREQVLVEELDAPLRPLGLVPHTHDLLDALSVVNRRPAHPSN